MHVNEYVEQVHDQMRAAAALGDERTQQIAATLAGTAEASVRLALIAAVSAVANEITAALLETNGGPAVTVAVDGDEIRVDIAQGPPEPAADPPVDEGEATARISLRLSERLKTDIEQAASQDGVSVNTWLVRSAGQALARSGAGGWGGGSGWGGWGGPGWGGPGGWGGNWGGGPHGRGGGTHRVTGWVNG
ncbi:MAG TPA: hypothetical protein VH373_01640 [Jatrophihabitantaceae bacterium]|jgi:hypothetical protein